MVRITDLLSLPPCSALARLGVERTALFSTVGTLARRRESYLLADGSDAIIREIDAETDRLHLAMERLDAAEREVLRREPRAASLTTMPRAVAVG
ncbi:hypothetical protein [Roseomonas sp. BN140053]|uniref:hypothetical protein n=1 Tax=Roseomonas sp. BN140053 TaxID=3391898 RepID=UPI0039EA3E84